MASPADGSRGCYTPNWIELDGVVNMRDVGSMPTSDGSTLRSGVLVRTDNLQDLPPASVDWLVKELGVTDVVDLRTNLERRGTGDGPLKAVETITFHELSLYPEAVAETGIPDDAEVTDDPPLPWEEEVPPTNQEPHEVHLARHYLGYLERRPDSILAALRVIAHAQGAVLVHCAAGKDRTGTVCALAERLVGVADEVVVADYAASNVRIDKIFARLASSPVYAADLAKQTVADQTTPAATMEMVLRAIDIREGSLEAWLAGHGWSADDTRALRARLLPDGKEGAE